MNRNQLKLSACAAMLADHMGYLLFPQITLLRYIGRIAMPVFAFFIGEGCIHTSNRKKYFLSLFILASACQAVYIIEDLITEGSLSVSSDCWYFNILFTFAFSSLAGMKLNDAASKARKKEKFASDLSVFLLISAVFTAVSVLFSVLEKQGAAFYFDYGICGFLLPLSGIVFRNKYSKLTAFSVMLLIYCFVFSPSTHYVWYSLLSIPLLAFYNGKAGSRKFKYFFYIFYPAHLGILYLISMFMY